MPKHYSSVLWQNIPTQYAEMFIKCDRQMHSKGLTRALIPHNEGAYRM